MTWRRGFVSTVTVQAEVDVDEVLNDIGDEQLLQLVEDRGLYPAFTLGCDQSDAERAIEFLRLGLVSDALAVLERSLHPKFHSRAECEKRLAAMRSAH